MQTVLRHRGFRILAALYAADSFLGWLGSIALMVLVFQRTNSTAAAAAMLLCKQILPGLIVPAFGPMLDRSSARSALAFAFAAQAAALIALGYLGYGVVLFPLAALAGTAGAVVRTSLRATAARSLEGPDFRAGNAVLNVLMGLAGLAGPALAGVAVATIGAPPTLMIAGLAFAACALGVATLVPAAAGAGTATDEPAEPAGTTPAAPRRASLVPAGWLLAGAAIVTCLFSMDEPALLAYSEHSLGAGVGGYGAIYAAWGLGVTLGSVLFARLLRWSMLTVAVSSAAVVAASYIGLGVAPTIVVACAFAVVSGVGNGLCWVAILTAVQEAAAPGQEARTASRLEATAMAAPGLGILIGGVLAEFAGPRLTLLIPGVLVLTLLVLGVLAFRVRALAATSSSSPSVLSPSTPGGPA